MLYRLIAPFLLVVIAAWLFVGVESIRKEHGQVEYVPFLKQSPSFAVMYENPVICGECDLRSLDTLDAADTKRFNVFCRARFGLDPRPCYALFAEKQHTADKRWKLTLQASMKTHAPVEPSALRGKTEGFLSDSELCEHLKGEVPEPGDRSSYSPSVEDINQACAAATPSRLRVLRVGPSRHTDAAHPEDEPSCADWRLGAAQVERFFELSRVYAENPYHEFYQVSCVISGEVQSEGKTWAFEIDGGGTATWKAPGSATRYWGCSVKECEPLALLLTDFVEG